MTSRIWVHVVPRRGSRISTCDLKVSWIPNEALQGIHESLLGCLVFTTPKGRPLDPTNLTRRFRRLLRSAGLRTIRFHDLRHSTDTLLLEQGVDLVVIKELLGHAHIGVTAGVYAHVRLRLQRQAIDTLNDILGTGSDDREDPPSAASVR